MMTKGSGSWENHRAVSPGGQGGRRVGPGRPERAGRRRGGGKSRQPFPIREIRVIGGGRTRSESRRTSAVRGPSFSAVHGRSCTPSLAHPCPSEFIRGYPPAGRVVSAMRPEAWADGSSSANSGWASVPTVSQLNSPSLRAEPRGAVRDSPPLTIVQAAPSASPQFRGFGAVAARHRAASVVSAPSRHSRRPGVIPTKT